jgi:hypothetical protein
VQGQRTKPDRVWRRAIIAAAVLTSMALAARPLAARLGIFQQAAPDAAQSTQPNMPQAEPDAKQDSNQNADQGSNKNADQDDDQDAQPAEQEDDNPQPQAPQVQDTKPKPANVVEPPLPSTLTGQQKQLIEDTDRLYALATELKSEVDKTNQNMLSVQVVLKADEIEKLARSIRDRSKPEEAH